MYLSPCSTRPMSDTQQPPAGWLTPLNAAGPHAPLRKTAASASCPQPTYPGAMAAAVVAARLAEATQHPAHHFWPDDLSLLETGRHELATRAGAPPGHRPLPAGTGRASSRTLRRLRRTHGCSRRARRTSHAPCRAVNRGATAAQAKQRCAIRMSMRLRKRAIGWGRVRGTW